MQNVTMGEQNQIFPHPSGFPWIVWMLRTWECFLRGNCRWFWRAYEMKFPEDPESRRAGTAMEWTGVITCTVMHDK